MKLGIVLLWVSFAVTILGIVVSIWLAGLAKGGALFLFAALLTAGIVVFGLHHAAELMVARGLILSDGLEALSSSIFLAATLYLSYRLRKALYGE